MMDFLGDMVLVNYDNTMYSCNIHIAVQIVCINMSYTPIALIVVLITSLQCNTGQLINIRHDPLKVAEVGTAAASG